MTDIASQSNGPDGTEMEDIKHRSLWIDVWQQFRTHKGAMVGVAVFVIICLGVIVGPLLYGVMLKSDVSHAECLAVFAALALLTAFMPLLVNRPAGRITR